MKKRNTLPPVAERPRCRGCGRALPPAYRLVSRTLTVPDVSATAVTGKLVVKTITEDTRELVGWGVRVDHGAPDGTFCTLRCGYEFGLRRSLLESTSPEGCV